MTIEEAIEHLEGRCMTVTMCASFDEAKEESEAIKMAISALRSQQDAEKNDPLHGCDFCNGFDFSSAIKDVSKYGAHIKMAGGAFRYPQHEWFNYCPVCGRPVNKTC